MICPRRIGTLADTELYAGSKVDEWREDNTCSFCGGINPMKLLEMLKSGGWHVVPTDKSYKFYIDKVGEYSSRFKFYTMHASREQIDELNKTLRGY